MHIASKSFTSVFPMVIGSSSTYSNIEILGCASEEVYSYVSHSPGSLSREGEILGPPTGK